MGSTATGWARGPGIVSWLGRWHGIDGADAEIAVTVLDDWQGRGLGSLLATQLARAAQATGIVRFHAAMFQQNRRALAVVRKLGSTTITRAAYGVLEVVVELSPPVGLVTCRATS